MKRWMLGLRWGGLVGVGAPLWAGNATAHSFGRVLNLPVPLWLYLYGAAVALLLSLVVLVLKRPTPSHGQDAEAMPQSVRASGPWLNRLALAALVLTVVTGFFGTQNPFRNFSMTGFWVVFLLAGLYASALGLRMNALNPWRAMLAPLKWPGWPRLQNKNLAHGPALLCFGALIVFELFGPGTPRALALALVVYTLLTLTGAWLFGSEKWARHGEALGAYFEVAERLAPFDFRAGGSRFGRRRMPSVVQRLARSQVPDLGLALLVVFMLSSTAFDGLMDTVAWNALYWDRVAPWLSPLLGANVAKNYAALASIQRSFNALSLVLSPLVYVLACMGALAGWRALVRQPTVAHTPLRVLLLALIPSLIPIAVFYNLAHYFVLVLSQGIQLGALLLDPFGLAAAPAFKLPVSLAPTVVWHLQVLFILTGHVIGMAIAHRRFDALGGTQGRPLPHLPLLVLMTALTASGLWILAQPISPNRLF